MLELVEVDYLDEVQCKALAIPDSKWEDFMEKVRPLEVDMAMA